MNDGTVLRKQSISTQDCICMRWCSFDSDKDHLFSMDVIFIRRPS
jgi:hypothetical protein